MTELVVATVTTGIAMASTPVVRGAMSAGTGIYYGTTTYKALKNRKKNQILKKKSSDRDRFVEDLMKQKQLETAMKANNEMMKKEVKLKEMEELHKKFVEKKMLKFWKIYTNLAVDIKAATLIQKIYRRYQQYHKYRNAPIGVVGQGFWSVEKRRKIYFHGIDSDSWWYFKHIIATTFGYFHDTKATMIQKIYRGYRQRRKYKSASLQASHF